MKLYVARHGQTEWNQLGKVCGTINPPLSGEGEVQAHSLAEKLAQTPVKRILCSPLLRAKTTASIVAEDTGIPFQVELRLREIDFGIFEGGKVDDPRFIQAQKEFACRFPGGESPLGAAHRIYSLLDEIKELEESVLLITHGGICRVLHSYFFDLTNQDLGQFRTANCELREYLWE